MSNPGPRATPPLASTRLREFETSTRNCVTQGYIQPWYGEIVLWLVELAKSVEDVRDARLLTADDAHLEAALDRLEKVLEAQPHV